MAPASLQWSSTTNVAAVKEVDVMYEYTPKNIDVDAVLYLNFEHRYMHT